MIMIIFISITVHTLKYYSFIGNTKPMGSRALQAKKLTLKLTNNNTKTRGQDYLYHFLRETLHWH